MPREAFVRVVDLDESRGVMARCRRPARAGELPNGQRRWHAGARYPSGATKLDFGSISREGWRASDFARRAVSCARSTLGCVVRSRVSYCDCSRGDAWCSHANSPVFCSSCLCVAHLSVQGFVESQDLTEAPGSIASRTKNAATYIGGTGITLEGEVEQRHVAVEAVLALMCDLNRGTAL